MKMIALWFGLFCVTCSAWSMGKKPTPEMGPVDGTQYKDFLRYLSTSNFYDPNTIYSEIDLSGTFVAGENTGKPCFIEVSPSNGYSDDEGMQWKVYDDATFQHIITRVQLGTQYWWDGYPENGKTHYVSWTYLHQKGRPLNFYTKLGYDCHLVKDTLKGCKYRESFIYVSSPTPTTIDLHLKSEEANAQELVCRIPLNGLPSAAPKVALSHFATDAKGNFLPVNQHEAKKYCESLGMHLPTARELAAFAVGQGAFGFSSTYSTLDDFYSLEGFNYSAYGFISPIKHGELYRFWSSSINENNSFGFAMDSYSGQISWYFRDWAEEENGINIVGCIDGPA